MKAADLLLRNNIINQGQYDVVQRIAVGMAERSEEVMIGNSVLSEADLLRHLSALYRTKFASSERLSKADIPRATLEMIPRRVAETFMVFPVLFDAQTQTLSIVAVEPDDKNLLKEIQLVSGARDVKAFFARPAAITACIQKHHGKDPRAFDRFENERHMAMMGHATGPTLNLGGRAVTTAPNQASSAAPSAPTFGLAAPQRSSSEGARTISLPNMAAVRPPTAGLELEAPAPPRAPQAAQRPASYAPAPALARRDSQPAPAPAAARAPESQRPQGLLSRGLDSPFGADSSPPSALGKDAATLSKAAVVDALIDSSNVLVSLLENNRPDLRGHSAHVARLVRRLCERLRLSRPETQAYVLAAHLHDLAKMGQFHLTALNVADYDGHRVAAEKVVETPVRLMEAVKLPDGTRDSLRQMYERWNGSGFPDGRAGKEISLGARILALCDVYADLTHNPRNPYRTMLVAADACAALTQHRERVFDPHLVDLFRTVVTGEDVVSRLLEANVRALIVDPDPEESTVLELRMIEQGFEVVTARTLESARVLLAKGDIELVISEIGLPDGNGLGLLSEARVSAWGKELPWVIHTAMQNRGDAQRAFELGALDYVSKPAPAEVFVAKLRALTGNTKKTKARGVSGSLAEMGLPDIVQVLFHGRKSGKLVLSSGGKNGEVHFLEGAVVNASFDGRQGAEAFYALLKRTDGDFALDPSFLPTERLIQESSEALLLEGLRRLDEGIG
jgi:response regulator RpfG family c-di-GMP phosphodiesterase